MNCKELLNTQSYLDGELSGAKSAEAERHIQTCSKCQSFATVAADLSDAMRKGVRYCAPDLLRHTVLARLDVEPVGSARRSFWLGAAGGAGVSAMAAAFALLAVLPPSITTFTQSVVEAHARALTSAQTVAVASSNHHMVKPWLAAHAGISPPVIDFAKDGFALTGGRVDEVAGKPAAVIVYAHGRHELDLFAWPDQGTPLPGPGMSRGFRTTFWKVGDLDFAAVSDVDQGTFQTFVSLVRNQRE